MNKVEESHTTNPSRSKFVSIYGNKLLHWPQYGQSTLFENESIIDINYPDLLVPDLG